MLEVARNQNKQLHSSVGYGKQQPSLALKRFLSDHNTSVIDLSLIDQLEDGYTRLEVITLTF